jgi:hypothetical protein
MVRATCGVATGGGADASRLHLSVLAPTGAPVGQAIVIDGSAPVHAA